MYGRVGAVESGNPYGDPPSTYPGDVAYAAMGSSWRDTTSLYGPLFTLGSELQARIAGDDPERAAWLFRLVAGAAFLVLWVIDRVRRRERVGLAGLGAGVVGLVGIAVARYGATWLEAFGGLSSQARRTGSMVPREVARGRRARPPRDPRDDRPRDTRRLRMARR